MFARGQGRQYIDQLIDRLANKLAPTGERPCLSILVGFDRLRRQAKAAQAAFYALEVVDQAWPARHGDAHCQYVDNH